MMTKFIVLHLWPETLGGNASVMPAIYNDVVEALDAAKTFERLDNSNGKGGHKYIVAHAPGAMFNHKYEG